MRYLDIYLYYLSYILDIQNLELLLIDAGIVFDSKNERVRANKQALHYQRPLLSIFMHTEIQFNQFAELKCIYADLFNVPISGDCASKHSTRNCIEALQ